MNKMIPGELVSRIGGGLLAFPVTHFDEQGEFVERRYREHIAWLVENDPAGLFAAGGTGEYLHSHSLIMGSLKFVVAIPGA